MNELELIIDFQKDAERQGPGSERTTVMALEMIDLPLNQDNKVADIGCGSGAQTLALAKRIQGQISAVDLFPEFLHKLKERAFHLGFQDKISTIQAPMEELPFEREAFDIIWSEGAIYNIGFKKGVQEWNQYLKPGGYLAASEITWITDSRPIELQEYWNEAYPEIDTASNKMRILEENGYAPVGYFILPPSCWLHNYYVPMEKRFAAFLDKHHHNDQVKKLVEQEEEEIRMYRKYQDYYSYGFYVARKL
jgi:ubiquinone/menaquinone biosynthesis C-methylase UbiE